MEDLLKAARAAVASQTAAGPPKAPPPPPKPDAWAGAPMPRGYGDISDAIEVQNCDLLNADADAGGVRSIFLASKPSALPGGGGGDDEHKNDWVQSSADEQMLLFMPFSSTLKLHTIQDGELERTTRPTHIKLYANRTGNLDFTEADETTPEQEFTIKPTDWNQLGTASLELRFVRFQNISSLVLYLVRGEGEPGEHLTRIDRLRLVGDTGEKRFAGKLEKVAEPEG